MSDLAQWVAYQRRAAVFGTSEETVLALLDVTEALVAQEEWEKAEAERELDCAYQPCEFRGCPHDEVWAKRDRANELRRAALARLVEVGQ